ncbi:pyrroline-5-carboxylate reductase [Erysipelothrix rhusiopathiae]|uniref:pyrroline-5-carboxylate reductase n=1 Tax=Erysipelothrix rhusiopathiae TaxID=1648 RepID=UPI000F434860|nr:pyrroline-5-carboxylate reductase [Erysipelothrix rhusiopathiae]AYV33768.1 pyrroline-5-carboxylate reductase [Erysipelothrix rhusiopathiae]MDE8081365.1 pyrroline-5-carboxylate reductase [Erysipelothrix rhusiopathiae]MDE8314128.1 pyrroline-5-carboxylate reductase [Erysipelothrix rhusiopathiae]MDE8330189.1 pyrroline-5-carboxylate reductase [Erysipelothrix rhusiopathiae]MDE8332652.1 pyrroline-5-carboxylate reductase [Erysipelothrix rhusiopathiae]
MKIGFIGVGNMANAIINGIENKDSIYISGRTYESTCDKASALGVHSCKSNRDCAQSVDLLFLSVKPEMFETVLNEIKPVLDHQTLVSIAAKKTLEDIESLSGPMPIIRVMPNLNVAIQRGISAICHNSRVTADALEEVQRIFDALGGFVSIPESQFSGFIGIAGSSPAFVFKFIDELAKSVLDEGFDYETALRITCAAVSGSADYLSQSGEPADVLVDRVCSPGGTTIEGVRALDASGFAEAIHAASHATILKDKQG